ncbi:TIR domain-containing protein [Winogradskyella costae]|uniref:TIR domain-containing protein n=1 Tax=Winogradskyella costae TaxID=2697008 RepID=UPI0015CD0C36|nr:TIR domain-containing protein [Winogradskyella costae]
MKAYLEDVFKTSGIPTHTFVRPNEYNTILVSLRTKGRCLVVEGPSGIGKTTCVIKVIEELGLNKNITSLTARKKDDLEMIRLLPEFQDMGTVIIDDFHLLEFDLKSSIADYMKVLADEERSNDKLILIGINKAGDSLVQIAGDLNNRIDTIKFEQNPPNKITDLIELGEKALNIKISTKEDIALLAKGSFHIAQLLSKETCIDSEVLDTCDKTKVLKSSIEVIKEKVLSDFDRIFYPKARKFAIGNRLRREGRAPYLHLLYWLSQSDEWAIQIDDLYLKYPENKLSITQIVDKGFLEAILRNNEELKDVIHYDTNSRVLAVEDPKFMFYLRNVLWSKFAEKVGYISLAFSNKYDFALSFAGENRNFASKINDLLLEREISVFYDKNEQSRILAENVEEYLAPIYKSEAYFVVVLLSKDYPKKIWTKFESDNFKERFGTNSIIPIWYSDNYPGLFDETQKLGGLSFDPSKDMDKQATEIVDIIIEKLSDHRTKEKK